MHLRLWRRKRPKEGRSVHEHQSNLAKLVPFGFTDIICCKEEEEEEDDDDDYE
jgi:hypothetical protein